MAPVYVLDHYYLAITLLVTVGYQLLGFAIAWTFQVRISRDFSYCTTTHLLFIYQV